MPGRSRTPRESSGGDQPRRTGAGRVAAVPRYLESNCDRATPGLRFGVYFRVYDRETWEVVKKEKAEALEEVVPLDREHNLLLESVRERQLRLAKGIDDEQCVVVEAEGGAPFVTGMGMEHPLENGFSFLWPYGLPYLPGSSVKGVVRRAAEELALFSDSADGWTLPAVWWLFGLDETSAYFHRDRDGEFDVIRSERARWKEAYANQAEALSEEAASLLEALARLGGEHTEAYRGDPKRLMKALLEDAQVEKKKKKLRDVLRLKGSLVFWDVLPVPAGRKLRVDIINPHYGHYYQKGQPPGDWGTPSPNYYLTMPAGSRYRFIVTLEPTGCLPAGLRDGWKKLLGAALEHAFLWLGFGAKTSLGYGLMNRQEAPPSGGHSGPDRPLFAPPGLVLSEAEEKILEIKAIPNARVMSEINSYVGWVLGQPDGPDKKRVAEAIIDKVGKKNARKRAKQKDLWARLLEIAEGEGGEGDR